MRRTLVWFQCNLRIQHNPALQWALENSDQILLLYVDAPLEEIPWQPGAASRWWLASSLEQLCEQFSGLGMSLNILRGSSLQLIPQLVSQYQIDTVCWQRSNEPHLDHRNQQLRQQLAALSVTVCESSDTLLAHPQQLLNKSEKPYRAFTPFYRRLRSELFGHLPASMGMGSAVETISLACGVEANQLCEPHPWQQKLAVLHQPGEVAALDQLAQFIDQCLVDYPQQRDFPALEITSQLSVALHFGELSAQQIALQLQPIINEGEAREASAAEVFLRQLIWREFAQYTLWNNPCTPDYCLDERFEHNFWLHNNSQLARWQRGETGVDIIDAAMQQLWQTGIMHNRMRMVVASFLTKNLGLHWQYGARWFWDTLVDADLANNTMGWQWVAGCGVDAAPYYRIFNPLTQAQRFDPEQRYIQRWLTHPGAAPMIDLAESRRAALARYQQQIQGRVVC